MTGFPFPELDAEKKAVYELFPIKLTRMLLHTHGLTLPYWKYALGFRHSTISAQVREQVIVRVAASAKCDYELVQHKSEALRTGTSPQLLADLADRRHCQFDDLALTALVGYVDWHTPEPNPILSMRCESTSTTTKSPKSLCWPARTSCAPYSSTHYRCRRMTAPSTGPRQTPT